MSSDTGETDVGAVDGRGEDFTEAPELIRERGLEIELELDLGNCRTHLFPVLSGSIEKNSGSLIAAEDVGAQLLSSDFPAGGGLDSRPVLGRDSRTLAQPLGDALLGDLRSAGMLADPLGELGLATDDLDSSTESDNVLRFPHEPRRYTTTVVRVNNHACVPSHNPACTVLSMAARTNKNAQPMSKQEIGPDGRTIGQRIERCMALKSRQLGRKYTHRELVEDATRAVRREPRTDPIMTQQNLSKLIIGESTDTVHIPALAAALGVESLWLGYGVGRPTLLDHEGPHSA